MAELTIAISKGRLEAETLELFAAARLRLPAHRDPRQLACLDESGETRFIFVKPSDVPVYVEHGIADCGVVGRDVLFESEADLLQPLSLEIGSCRIAVAAPADLPENGHAMLRVATKYPRIASRYFGERGQPVEIIQLSGSVELAPVLGFLHESICLRRKNAPRERSEGTTIVDQRPNWCKSGQLSTEGYDCRAHIHGGYATGEVARASGS